MTIKGSLYVKAVVGRKKLRPVWTGPQNGSLSAKYKSENYNFSHRDPHKALSYPERRPLTYFA